VTRLPRLDVVGKRTIQMRTLLAGLETEEAHEIICQAYTFGYPLVLMDVARRLMTGIRRLAEDESHDPFTPGIRVSSRTPQLNPDVLSGVGWFELAREPQLFRIPNYEGGFYSIQVIDAWTNVLASIGSRASASRYHDLIVVGPRSSSPRAHRGQLVLSSSTSVVWVLGRVEFASGQDDLFVLDLQRSLPIRLWSSDDRPFHNIATSVHADAGRSPQEHVARMEGAEFFARLNALMVDSPPSVADAKALSVFSAVGIGVGLPFEVKGDSALAKRVDASARTALARIVVEANRPSGYLVNGWWRSVRRAHEADYMSRAVIALADVGAAAAEEMVALRADIDANGEPLWGHHRYALRFPPRQLPPVRGFWSVAIYNARDEVVDNPIDRHAISSRRELTVARDGSITISIQQTSPGPARDANWLPVPHDHFHLVLRLYWPKHDVLTGSWAPPAIERLESGG
jgi:hypothetical protein